LDPEKERRRERGDAGVRVPGRDRKTTFRENGKKRKQIVR
jgi:hypothetical protein